MPGAVQGLRQILQEGALAVVRFRGCKQQSVNVLLGGIKFQIGAQSLKGLGKRGLFVRRKLGHTQLFPLLCRTVCTHGDHPQHFCPQHSHEFFFFADLCIEKVAPKQRTACQHSAQQPAQHGHACGGLRFFRHNGRLRDQGDLTDIRGRFDHGRGDLCDLLADGKGLLLVFPRDFDLQNRPIAHGFRGNVFRQLTAGGIQSQRIDHRLQHHIVFHNFACIQGHIGRIPERRIAVHAFRALIRR